ncbi:leucine-rich repeat-containing protein kinase family protein [Aeromonas eucrenophila]|uniref:Leucine-rich repeat-containing protein kinase family protein n=1 Tax=Aeromonas eucrenophila TaxID=649 RepID=A0ABW0YHQ4_9GAMM|nr:leucine-rich repeat-containing protein kinase family protein [Aeromonas eucrenophila]
MHTLEQLHAGELNGARHLKLCENLTTFPLEILSLKETLEVLDLTGNQLSELPGELAECTKLRIIFCSENNFTALPEVLGNCPALTMVGFKANRIAVVSPQSLPTRLRWLILTDNAIEHLPEELGQCASLQKLMLAGNRLTELPVSLVNCQRLELLRISANRLEALPEWLLSLPRLSWLAYAGNPFAEAWELQAGTEVAVDEIPWQALEVGELLGQGASGAIHRAHWHPELGQAAGQPQELALKLFKGAMTSDGLPAAEMTAAMAVGRHPALIEVMGRVSDHPSGIPALGMALIDPAFVNLAGPPSLDSCTRDIYPTGLYLTLATALEMASQIASAAAHLHRSGVMHGDLYGHNILHDGQGRALLGDFGAASFYPLGTPLLATRLERLEVRAFGCLLEELLALCPATAAACEAFHRLANECQRPEMTLRPSFAEIHARLGQIQLPLRAEMAPLMA